MNLYFIASDDPDGENAGTLELLVRCETPEEAIDHWRLHYSDDMIDRISEEEDLDEEEAKAKWMNSIPAQIWLAHPTTVGALWWHKEDGMKPIYDTRYHAEHTAKIALGLIDG